MEEREDLQQIIEKKIEQIIADDQNVIHNVDAAIIYQKLKRTHFIELYAPQEEMPVMQMLTMDSLRNFNQGHSIKPGNIRLNIRNLIDAIPSVVEMTVSIAVDIPILQVCATLNIWKTFKNIITVEITKDQAFVIAALWKNCNANHKIDLDAGYEAVNALFNKYGEAKMSMTKYHQIIDSLIELKCIKLENGVIWLREWISKKYIDSL